MLEFALALFLTAGTADGAVPNAANLPVHPATAVAVPTPGVQGQEKSQFRWTNSPTVMPAKAPGSDANRPVPAPVPLALLALGICGLAGASFASRRRGKKTVE